MTRPPRASAKAVVAEGDRVLLIHLRHPALGDFYQLPGGGVRRGERLADAVRRETREETGYSVSVHELLWIRDYLAADHGYAYLDPPGFHAVELMYRCSLTDALPADPHAIDDAQVGVDWVEGSRLSHITLLPRSLVAPLGAFLADRRVIQPIYLGEGP